MEFELPNQKPDEKILLMIKPHWIHLISVLFFFIAMIGLPIALYIIFGYLLGNLLDNQIIYAISTMIGGLYYLFIFAITFSSYLDYELDFWVVTNYRIIANEQKGLFNRAFAEHLIERIQDVSSIQKGFLPTILNYGDVEIQTAGMDDKFTFNDVANPEQKVSTINQLLSKKIQHPHDINTPSIQP